MNECQYLDFSALEAKQGKLHRPITGQEIDNLLTEVHNSLLSLKGQGGLEVEKHRDNIKEILALCASFFSETDSKGMLLISGKDREELMAAENIFNSFRKELSVAKDKKLQKLIEAITPELQLPLSSAALEQVKRNAAAHTEFLEQHAAYSSGDIHRMSGSTTANKAALASGWRSKGRIFAVNYNGKRCYPAFQFDDNTKPRKVIADVIKIFGEEDAGWQLALWFVTPNAMLDGKLPIDVIESDTKGLINAIKEEVDPTLC